MNSIRLSLTGGCLLLIALGLSAQVNLLTDYAKTQQNRPLYISPLTNDNGEGLSIRKVALVSHGQAEVSPEGDMIYYVPEPDYAGRAYIRYIACDEAGQCSSADIQIYIPDQTDLKQVDTIYNFSYKGRSNFFFFPLEGFTIAQPPRHGEIKMVPNSGFSFEYKPNPGFTGRDSIKVTWGSIFSRYYFIEVYEQPYTNTIAKNGVLYVLKSTPEEVRFDILNNFYTASEREGLTVISHTDLRTHTLGIPPQGYVTVAQSGLASYNPPNNFEGVQSFDYTVCKDNKCETGTIFIQLSAFKPKSDEPYDFRIAKNHPLLVHYNIPVDADKFRFEVLEQPLHGSLDFYEDIELPTFTCGNIKGTNLIIYEPQTNYTGQDRFKIKYILKDRTEAIINVNVQVQNVVQECNLEEDRIWPGDVNNNGRVDMLDLLHLGTNIGEVGTPRSETGIDWFSKSGIDWGKKINNVDLKHSDADGDGFITDQDLKAIDNNYSHAHSFIPEILPIPKDLPLFVEPVQAVLDSGDMAEINIVLGKENVPALDINGFLFTLEYNSGLVENNSVFVNFDNYSWLTQGASSVQLAKEPRSGSIDAGVSRTKGQTISGHGVVVKVGFVVRENVQGFKSDEEIPMHLKLHNVYIPGPAGQIYQLPDAFGMINIKTKAKRDRPLTNNDLVVFPNPAQSELNLYLNGYYNQLQSIVLFDMAGKIIKRIENPQHKQEKLEIHHLEPGFYVLQARTSKGVISKKVQVVR